MKNKGIIISLILLTVVVGGALAWYFVWRPSDADYQAALSHVETLREDTATLTSGLGSVVYVRQVDLNTLANLEKLSSSYTNAATALSTSPAISRDLVVSTTHASLSDSIDNYGQRLSSLAKSVKLYTSIASTCSKLDSDLANEDTGRTQRVQELSSCRGAIKAGKSVSDTVFNDVFMKKYLPKVSALLTQYENLYSATSPAERAAAEKAIIKIKRDVVEIGDTKLETSVGAAPTDAFAKLTSVLSSQKNSFFR